MCDSPTPCRTNPPPPLPSPAPLTPPCRPLCQHVRGGRLPTRAGWRQGPDLLAASLEGANARCCRQTISTRMHPAHTSQSNTSPFEFSAGWSPCGRASCRGVSPNHGAAGCEPWNLHSCIHTFQFDGVSLCWLDYFVRRPGCTGKGGERHGPDLGGCCAGLQEVAEPRPPSNPYYCTESAPGFGTSCWPTWQMCRPKGAHAQLWSQPALPCVSFSRLLCLLPSRALSRSRKHIGLAVPCFAVWMS